MKPELLLSRLLLKNPGITLALAESCTGGLIAARITAVPGSSAYFDRGFVVYSNEAKTDLLGVDPETIRTEGAVSGETALAMLEGLFERTGATLCAAVTGIAGPGGGTPEKPVGTVWISWGTKKNKQAERLCLKGGRAAVRRAAATAVLERLCGMAGDSNEGFHRD